MFFQNWEVISIAAILGIFTLLYALPLNGRRNLRGVPGIKIYIIAFVVAGVTVVLPLIEIIDFPSFDHIIDFVQRCIIAVVLILPFEIRDLNSDGTQLGTIPQKLGVPGTKTMGYGLTVVFCLMQFLKNDIEMAYTISLLFIGALCMFLLKKSSEDQQEYFASFWVEAAPMFWLGIFYVTKILI